MIAAVFFMQPIGALLANVVAIVTIAAFRNSIPNDSIYNDCHTECRDAVDNIWRWVVGIGAIPPAFAILLRWWIPESPRYTLEVEMDPDQARRDVHNYYTADPTTFLLNNSAPGPSTEEPEIRAHSIPSTSASQDPAHTNSLTFGESCEMKDFSLARNDSHSHTILNTAASTHRTVQTPCSSQFHLSL